MSTVLVLALAGVMMPSPNEAQITQADEFPSRAPDDAVMASANLAREVTEWAAAAFSGVARPGPGRVKIDVQRQDHGTFGFNKSCIGTTPLRIGAK